MNHIQSKKGEPCAAQTLVTHHRSIKYIRALYTIWLDTAHILHGSSTNFHHELVQLAPKLCGDRVCLHVALLAGQKSGG
jgi:hypothetical protein